MSCGAESVYNMLSPSERQQLCTQFGLSPEFLASALKADGLRFTIAGDRLLGLIIADFSPVSHYCGEHISFFASNLVISSYMSALLTLPADGRPGVTAAKLGDLFQACLALTAQKTSSGGGVGNVPASGIGFAGPGTVFNMNEESVERARRQGRAVIDWVLGGNSIHHVSIDQLKRSVQERAVAAENKRREHDEKTFAGAVSVSEYNVMLADRPRGPSGAPLMVKQGFVTLRYATRSGQERTVVAALCCGALDPKDCRCADVNESSRQQLAMRGGEFEFSAHLAEHSTSASASALATVPKQQLQHQQQQQQTQPCMARFHRGQLDEVRLTKTKAMKIQNIAIWNCCGAPAAMVNQTPIGFDVVPEMVNGCCTAGS